MQKKRLIRTFIPFLLPVAPLAAILIAHTAANAQQVQPVIMEYRNKAEGKFSVVNNTLEPMAVVLEPKSFSISPDGRGTFRNLDPTIHVQLSTMSVKLQPLQSYTVFYKADSESFPAWFTIYSTFSPARAGASLSVRVQLPHTVYLYQNKPIDQDEIHVLNARYSTTTHKLVCDMLNTGKALTRVQEVRTSGVHTEPVTLAGFPLLPGSLRTIEVEWKGKEPPTALNIAFDRFTLKPPFAIETDPPPAPVAGAPAVAQSGVAPQIPPLGR
jgi:hypothetical protein